MTGAEIGAGIESAAAAAKAAHGVLGWHRDRWGDPLYVSLRPVRDRGVWVLGTKTVLTAGDLAQLTGSGPQEVRRWLESGYEAVEVGERYFHLLLESASRREVTIEWCEAVVENRDPSRFGALVKSPDAGAVAATYLGLDLSLGADPTPVVVSRDLGTDWTTEPFFPGRRIVLSPGESHAVTVISRTGSDTASWRLRVVYRVRRRTREIVYPPLARRPFVTSGTTDAEQYFGAGVDGLQHPPYLSDLPRSGFA